MHDFLNFCLIFDSFQILFNGYVLIQRPEKCKYVLKGKIEKIHLLLSQLTLINHIK